MQLEGDFEMSLIRDSQQDALRRLHGAIGDEWGKKRFKILHALEDALQHMEEFHPDLDSEAREYQ
jgi:hypothetical protein